MNRQQLFEQIRKKKSFLCVGLDTDLEKIPGHLLSGTDPVFEFNRAIVDATAEFSIAVKPNLAFYESLGAAGWNSLQKTIVYVREQYPELFLIADAKRGDIGNTSSMYAAAFFDPDRSGLSFDAVTVAPYMGVDSVTPFLQYPGKWVILLTLTSNKGSGDFQLAREEKTGRSLYENVIRKSMEWASPEQMMYVVGATRAEMLGGIREIIPDHFLLVPGVGAQGGSLQEVARYGINNQCGLIVNSSRAIIYAGSTRQFAVAAANEASKVQKEMEEILKDKHLL